MFFLIYGTLDIIVLAQCFATGHSHYETMTADTHARRDRAQTPGLA